MRGGCRRPTSPAGASSARSRSGSFSSCRYPSGACWCSGDSRRRTWRSSSPAATWCGPRRRRPPRTACKLGGASALAGAAHGPNGRRLTLLDPGVALGSRDKIWLAASRWRANACPPPGRARGRQGSGGAGRPRWGPAAEGDRGGREQDGRIPSAPADPAAFARAIRARPGPDAPQRRQPGGERSSGSASRLTASPRTRPSARGRRSTFLARSWCGGEIPTAPSRATSQDALALDREAGLVSDEVADGIAFTVALIYDRHDLKRAGEVLDLIEGLLGDVPVGRALLPSYRALMARARGDPGLRARAHRSVRRRWPTKPGSRRPPVRRLPVQAGGARAPRPPRRRPPGAAGCWRTAASLPGSPCKPAPAALTNSRLAHDPGRDPRRAHPGGARGSGRHLRQGLRRPRRPAQRAHPHGALGGRRRTPRRGGGHPGAGPARAARRAREKRRRVGPRLRVPGARARSPGRGPAPLRRRRGPQAAHAAPSRTRRSRADFALAEALERLGLEAEALAAYAAAHAQLDRWSIAVPLGTGKQTFLGRYQRGVRRYLELPSSGARKTLAPGARGAASGLQGRRSRARLVVFAEWQHRLAHGARREARRAGPGR